MHGHTCTATLVLHAIFHRDGSRLGRLCLSDPNIHQLEVHVFQTASLTPTQSTRLSAVMDMVNVLARRVVTHAAAAGSAESVVTVHSEGCFRCGGVLARTACHCDKIYTVFVVMAHGVMFAN